jgi:diguanylate cyclase (GGDEF)-like protein
VARALYSLIQGQDPDLEHLDTVLAALARDHGELVYAELIFLLTRLRLDPAEAKRHWPAALARQREIERHLGKGVDLRAVLLSYFTDVERHLARPKVVEMDWAERTVAAALLDEVTGLPNQRFFREQLARDVEHSVMENLPLSLIVMDLDDFKHVNDRHGHDVGTVVLCALASRLRARARERDLVVRYGGDEFVVVCPATPKLEAAHLGEALRAAVASLQIEAPDGGRLSGLTVSVGVATCPGDARDGHTLFVAADGSAYQAKLLGKNRVELFGGSSRSYTRTKLVWPGRCELAGGGATPFVTTEIGEGGFAFKSDRAFAADALVEAVLQPQRGDEMRIAGRVAWSRDLGAGQWAVAIRFIENACPARERLSRLVGTAPIAHDTGD